MRQHERHATGASNHPGSNRVEAVKYGSGYGSGSGYGDGDGDGDGYD